MNPELIFWHLSTSICIQIALRTHLDTSRASTPPSRAMTPLRSAAPAAARRRRSCAPASRWRRACATTAAPHSGTVAWCRGLAARIEEPMAKLRSLKTKVVMESEAAKDITRLYSSVMAAITEYERNTVEARTSCGCRCCCARRRRACRSSRSTSTQCWCACCARSSTSSSWASRCPRRR